MPLMGLSLILGKTDSLGNGRNRVWQHWTLPSLCQWKNHLWLTVISFPKFLRNPQQAVAFLDHGFTITKYPEGDNYKVDMSFVSICPFCNFKNAISNIIIIVSKWYGLFSDLASFSSPGWVWIAHGFHMFCAGGHLWNFCMCCCEIHFNLIHLSCMATHSLQQH